MTTKSEMVNYLRLIFGKWILWLFLVLDVVGAIVQFFIPDFNLPITLYGLLAIIGFFWAGFQVHNESKASYERLLEAHRAQMEKISGELNINAILKTPSLDLALQEGHEYIFTFSKSPSMEQALYTLSKKMSKKNEANETPYFLPYAKLQIFPRIQNTGCT
jgi:hypothetical protein